MTGQATLRRPRPPKAEGAAPKEAAPDGSGTVVPMQVVVQGLADAQPAWRALLPRATATPYQSFAWIEAWCATEGARRGIEVAVATAVAADGRPLAVLPLGIERLGPLRLASFLGGRESNGNMGLFETGVPWSAEDLRAVLDGIAKRMRVDAFLLRNQPRAWFGAFNPMTILPGQPSPSASHAARLGADAEATLRRLSPHARKRLRHKRSKLQALGALRHEVARTPEDVVAVLDAYERHKAGRSDTAAGRSDAERQSWRGFLIAAADPTQPDPAPVELHALLCGPDIVATFGGARNEAGHFSGMFVSFDPRPDIARYSPGEQLVAVVMGYLADRGFSSFDLGIGEARYKESLCPDEVALFDSYIGISSTGRLVAALLARAARTKRRLKQSQRLWPLIQRVRRSLARASS